MQVTAAQFRTCLQIVEEALGLAEAEGVGIAFRLVVPFSREREGLIELVVDNINSGQLRRNANRFFILPNGVSSHLRNIIQ
jgi:hypothetical protein